MSGPHEVSIPFFQIEHGMEVRRTPSDEVPYAVFSGRVPTTRERRIILRNGWGLHLVEVTDADASLSFLKSFQGLTHLGVISARADTRVVTSLTSLEVLSLNAPDSPPTDLSRLRLLRTFHGALQGNESVLETPLEVASFEDVRESRFDAVPPTVRELTLMDASQIRSLRPQTESTALETLVVDRARVFDAACLTKFPRLRKVYLMGIHEVINLSALVDTNIELLSFVHCRALPEVSALRQLAGVDIYVFGKLASTLEDLGEGSAANWTFSRRA